MLPLKAMIKHRRRAGEEDDAVGEHELVAAVGHLPRQVAVAGDDRRQRREPGVRRVRGQHEDAERGELDHPEQHVLAAEHVLRHQRDAGRVVLAAVRLEMRRQHRDAEEPGAEDAPMIASVIEALRLSGLRNVCTPLDTASTPDRATAPDENARRSMNSHSVCRAGGQVSGLLGQVVERDRAEVAEEHAVQADDDEHGEHHDVEVRRRGEQRARLAHAAQVGDRDHGDDHRGTAARAPTVEAERRLHRQHAAGDGHGDGEDVVGEQRRPGDERRHLAEVVLRDDVGAAARRVGVDRLAVRQDDDEQQGGDDDREGTRRVEGDGADARLEQQDDEDLVGRVRRRRHRVGREDRQGDALAQPLMALLGRGDRLADQHPLGQRDHTALDSRVPIDRRYVVFVASLESLACTSSSSGAAGWVRRWRTTCWQRATPWRSSTGAPRRSGGCPTTSPARRAGHRLRPRPPDRGRHRASRRRRRGDQR